MDSINEALIACVVAAGGSKCVGPKLWPEKQVDAAQRLLLDCLNEDRPQKLAPEQVWLVFKLAREVGCHAGMQYLGASLSYECRPIAPKDEADELKRQFIAATKHLATLAQRIEQIERPIRSVA